MTATRPVALVTGASSGIGKAATHAVEGYIVPARFFDKSIRKINRMVG